MAGKRRRGPCERGGGDRAKLAVAAKASALRGAILLADSFPQDQQAMLRHHINLHIEHAASEEWGSMAHHHLTMATLPTHLIEALKVTLALDPADETQRTAQREINDLHRAFESRRQRIVISQSSVSAVKWAAILLQALCALIAIVMVQRDNRLTCAIALAIFATGVAVSVPLIAAYSRPFTGGFSIGPDLLQQVIAAEPVIGAGPRPGP